MQIPKTHSVLVDKLKTRKRVEGRIFLSTIKVTLPDKRIYRLDKSFMCA